MSGGPDFELQKAIAARLKLDATLVSLTGVNAKIFQDVPPNPTFPYIKIGESQDLLDEFECIQGSEIFLTLRVYSKAPGYEQLKRIARAIYVSLHDEEDSITLDEHRLIILKRDSEIYRGDEDEVIKQGILVYRAITEPLDL